MAGAWLFNSDVIKVAIVLYRMEFPILFVNEEEGAGNW